MSAFGRAKAGENQTHRNLSMRERKRKAKCGCWCIPCVEQRHAYCAGPHHCDRQVTPRG